jgi:hypothetical protein
MYNDFTIYKRRTGTSSGCVEDLANERASYRRSYFYCTKAVLGVATDGIRHNGEWNMEYWTEVWMGDVLTEY